MKKRFFILLILLSVVLIHAGRAWSQEKEETDLYRKGSLYSFQAKWLPASETFDKLLQKYPDTDYSDSRFWLGYSLIELRKFQQGISQMMQFAKEHPENPYAPQALFKIGEVYEKRMQDYDRALVAYARVEQHYPGNEAAMSAIQNQADIYQQKKFNYPAAIERSEAAQNTAGSQGIDPTSPYVKKASERINFIKRNDDFDYVPLKMFTKAQNFEAAKEFDKAMDIYNRVLEEYPTAKICDDALYRIIVIHRLKEQNREAEEKAKSFLKKYPNSEYKNDVTSIINSIQSERSQVEFPEEYREDLFYV